MTTSPDVSMEVMPMDHGGGGAALLAVAAAPAAPAPVAVLRKQLSYTCSRGRCEPMHERKLSHSYSFSSAAASLSMSSPASSTSSRSYHAAMSSKSLSCDSIPVVPAELEMDKQSSFSSSASSYESFFQLEAADLNRITAAATQAPAEQTMMASGEQQQFGGSGGGYDPRRLPSSMFRAVSTSPGDMVDWSVTSNDSLFSINLRHSGDLSARYNNNHSGDLFYDASGGGFQRLPSVGHDSSSPWRLSSVSERLSTTPAAAGGGLCVSDSCARCSIAAGKNRKSVRFASSAEIVSGEINHSAVFPTLADALGEVAEEPAPATEGKETTKSPGAAAQGGWCLFRCCWPSPPSVWWPRCGCGSDGGGGGGGCSMFCCGEYCRC